MELDARVLTDEVDHRGAGPRFGEVDALAAQLEHGVAVARRARRGDDEALGELHHVVVVGERLVRLEHRELGVVAGVDALVAEDAPDLEHALEPADDQSLEVQLGGDAEVEVDVERVVVGDERSRRRAAELVAEHRRLDLDEAACRRARAGSRRPRRSGPRTRAGRPR